MPHKALQLLQLLAVELDSELTDTLRRVRVYARSEANEEQDFAAFVAGEMSTHDPAEGEGQNAV